jgi:exosome complex RNA-binding protein Rrp42 (RNase PH superfamily)
MLRYPTRVPPIAETDRWWPTARRSAQVVDLAALVIIPGQLVWTLHLDVYCLNHDGNLTDAVFLAAMAALQASSFLSYRRLDP